LLEILPRRSLGAAAMAWLSKLRQLVCEFWRVLQIIFRYIFFSKKRTTACGGVACPPALKKPDPFLYCQYYLLSLGFPVTWDNPDITIFEGGVEVNPYNLKASTTYTVVARIWNNSLDVPVINLIVIFSYLSFGMGTKLNPIGATTTNLGAKGLPGCPAFASTLWTTPAALGHYCLQVFLLPPDDLNWLNNLGQRNTQVTQPQSPATFSFTVGNHETQRSRTVRFLVDTYSIPPLLACPPNETCGGAPREISKVAPPVPDGWTVSFSPSELVLQPDEETPVQAAITPPTGYSGMMPFNITAYEGATPIGGVTVVVEVP
jgi:hypothetical protein